MPERPHRTGRRAKDAPIRLKAVDGTLADGQFVALAAVFGNIDAYGDVILPGAFADDLAQWKASGETIPVYWGHRMDDPTMCIGRVLEAAETADGLQVKVQLDIGVNGKADRVHEMLLDKRVARMSFAYDVIDGGWGEREGQEVYELRALKLHEVSVVQVPANPSAVVQDVKTMPAVLVHQRGETFTVSNGAYDFAVTDPAPIDRLLTGLKAGRVLSAANETSLRSALTKIADAVGDVKAVLDSIDTSNDDGKAAPAQPASEEPHGANDAARPGPASIRLLTDLDIEILT